MSYGIGQTDGYWVALVSLVLTLPPTTGDKIAREQFFYDGEH